MNSQGITVTAKWTAKPGKVDELKDTWQAVAQQVKANEPGVTRLDCYEVQGEDAVIVHEEFQDGAALAMHLGGTAATFFPKLLEIADPGAYFFCGEVTDEVVQAAAGMNLGALFATRTFGFSRDPSESV